MTEIVFRTADHQGLTFRAVPGLLREAGIPVIDGFECYDSAALLALAVNRGSIDVRDDPKFFGWIITWRDGKRE